MKVEINGIDALIRKLEAKRDSLEEKKRLFMERLAQIGVDTARVNFSKAIYDGNNDVVVETVWQDDHTLSVSASGTSVLFIEFGSGLIGYGHELAGSMKYGPGTWSDSELGKGHWQDEKGWYYEHGKKSHGNPPARAMYEASKEMRERIKQIAAEVFGND